MKRMLLLSCVMLGFVLGASVPTVMAQSYTVSFVASPDSFTQPSAINNNGLVGGSSYATLYSFWSNGFLGTADQFTLVPPMSNNGLSSVITGVADDGSSCGISMKDGVLPEAFRRTVDGNLYDLRTWNNLGENVHTVSTGMNNDYIVGYIETWNNAPRPASKTRTRIPAINNSRTVGSRINAKNLFPPSVSGYEQDGAVYWDQYNIMHRLPVDTNATFQICYAFHISWDGTIDGYGNPYGVWLPCYWKDANAPIVWLPIAAGTFGISYAGYGNVHVGSIAIVNDSTNTTMAARWVDGQLEILHDLGGHFAIAYGVDPLGNTVGVSTTGDNNWHLTLWRAGSLDPINLDTITLGDGWRLYQGIDVNKNGQIVALGENYVPWVGTIQYGTFILTPTSTAVDPGSRPHDTVFTSGFWVKPNGRIEFTLAKAGQVTASFYDVTGRKVDTVTGSFPAGKNNLRWDNRSHPNGVYFLRMQTPDQVFMRKITVLR